MASVITEALFREQLRGRLPVPDEAQPTGERPGGSSDAQSSRKLRREPLQLLADRRQPELLLWRRPAEHVELRICRAPVAHRASAQCHRQWANDLFRSLRADALLALRRDSPKMLQLVVATCVLSAATPIK